MGIYYGFPFQVLLSIKDNRKLTLSSMYIIAKKNFFDGSLDNQIQTNAHDFKILKSSTKKKIISETLKTCHFTMCASIHT